MHAKYAAEVSNFANSQSLEVRITICDPKKLVSLCQYSGGFTFHHHMTPTQASELAAHLLKAVESLHGAEVAA